MSFPAGSAVRLVNAYPAPEIRRLRSEGSHHLEIDLRDWTARLASELAFELGRRGVTAHVPDASLAGTSMDPGLPSRLPASPEALPALLVRVTEVQGPDPEGRRGPRLRADIESAGGDLAASFEAGEGTRGFRDALFDLKKKILDDARIQGWIQEKRAP